MERIEEILEEYELVDKAFSVIKWTKTDVKNLLKENDRDCSEEAVNKFLADFDIQFFEERCIQFGWELLQWGIR